MVLWIDLDKTPKKVMVILNVIVIILLLCSSYLLYKEIYFVKKYGGQCVNNPMRWAEYYAFTEKGERIDCSCIKVGGGFLGGMEINLTEE